MVFVKTLIFTVLVPGTVAVWVPYRFLASAAESSFFEAGPLRFLGLVPIALGAAGYFRCAWDFAVVGRGTPAPIDAPKVLVARGLYRWVRNPMYVSVLLVLLGEGLFFESRTLLIYAACVAVGFHLFVLLYEEPTLNDKFGGSYEEYCKTVPRWMPRIRRRGPRACDEQ